MAVPETKAETLRQWVVKWLIEADYCNTNGVIHGDGVGSEYTVHVLPVGELERLRKHNELLRRDVVYRAELGGRQSVLIEKYEILLADVHALISNGTQRASIIATIDRRHDAITEYDRETKRETKGTPS